MTAIAESGRPEGARTTEDLRSEPARLDEVFNRLRERVQSGALPAAALAIGDAEGEIRSETFSTDARGLSRDSLFFLASVTKPIFATAFMQLVDDGLISLHDPVARYLPSFASHPGKAEVTPWHLLTHTSGVPDVAPDVIRRSRPSAARMTEMALEAPLNFQPGARYEYCTTTFYVLAKLVERLTGARYTDYLRERMFEPLGMQSTFDPRRSRRPVVAVHGVGVDNRLIRFIVLRYLAAAAVPGGGLFGTLDDLLRFGAATLRPERIGERHVPLSPNQIEVMMQDHLRGLPGVFDGEEKPVHFGLSWGKPTLMRDLPGSAGVVSHGGATGTRLWIDPGAGLVIVFFTNQWAPDRGPEAEAIHGTYEALGLA
ncbi:MAG: serine hydrolase domain-containing protein [Candidatus Limnocylindrales bacterium]